MSLVLKRIELANIRSHKSITFEPAEDGITAISGVNGSGKSTIVDSLAWALWGTKPSGVSKVLSLVREGTQLGKEKCYAQVEFLIEGGEFRVERRVVTKGGAVECEVWERAEGAKDFKQVAGPAVSHAEPYIRKRLKMDEKGFLAAVMVQQKQVDQLISATPRERAEVLEKLTGISSITAGLVDARQQYNSLRKVLQLTTVDENTATLLKEEERKKKEESSKVATALTKAQESYKKVQEEQQEAQGKLTQAEAAAEANERGRQEVTEKKAQVETLGEELVRLTRMKDEKKKGLPSLAAGGGLQETEAAYRAAQGALRTHERQVAGLESSLKTLCKQAEAHGALVEKSTLKTLPEAATGLAKYERARRGLQARLAQSDEAAAGVRASLTKVEGAIKIITGGDGTCPTCLQHVHNMDEAVASLRGEVERLQATLTQEGSTREEILVKSKQAEEAHGKFTALVEALQGLEEVEGKREALQEQVNKLMEEGTELEARLTLAEKVYHAAKHHAELQAEYESLLQATVEVSDRREGLLARVAEVEAELKKQASPTASSLASLRKKAGALGEALTKSLEEVSRLREEHSLLEAHLEFLAEKIATAEDEVKRYKELMKSVEVAGASVDIIEEFREERIKSSVPLVSNYASDLLSRFTEGRFTQLALDEKFNATVTLSNGYTRPVGLLSGGELSAAALSLRLAVNLLLNAGASKNALILDEVLVSQDTVRAELILTAIKEVCQGQVIIISHGPNTNEIADKVVEL